MRIAVLGAGAMGCLFGGALARCGHSVTMIDVSKAQIEALSKNGITLTTDEGHFQIPVTAGFASEIKGPFELLILFTKGMHSNAALSSVKHLLTGDIRVLSLQNGIGHQEIIEKYVAARQIIVGMTGYPADTVEPGKVKSHGSSHTAIVDANGEISGFTLALGEEITKAGLNCKVSKDVFKDIWEKVAFNAAANCTTTLTQLSIGDFMGVGLGRELIYEIAKETVAVANAKNIPAAFENVKKMLDHVAVAQYGHKSSMLQDYLAKRQTEVEFINGAIVRAARAVRLDAPYNFAAYALISTLQNTYQNRCQPVQE